MIFPILYVLEIPYGIIYLFKMFIIPTIAYEYVKVMLENQWQRFILLVLASEICWNG